jgi:hypothetical protein
MFIHEGKGLTPLIPPTDPISACRFPESQSLLAQATDIYIALPFSVLMTSNNFLKYESSTCTLGKKIVADLWTRVIPRLRENDDFESEGSMNRLHTETCIRASLDLRTSSLMEVIRLSWDE